MHTLRSLSLAALAVATLILAVPSARAEMMHLQIDPQKTEITATVREPLSNLRDQPYADGTFQVVSGEIDGDTANVTGTGHIKLVIDATSYSSGVNMRDRNVLSSTLETRLYDKISFESTRIEDIDLETPTVGKATVVGNLTLHGTTREMRIPVNASVSPEGVFTGSGEVTFKYTEFGMRAPRLLFALPASNEVTIKFRVIATRPATGAPQASN